MNISNLIRDEDGGAYTLSYMMAIPVLALLLCVIVETTLMMSAKVGTVYAAYSGARTGVVWSSASRSRSDADDRIREAAIKSFVPFASSTKASGGSVTTVDSAKYAKSYAEFAKTPVAKGYVQSKFENAASLIKVTSSGSPSKFDSPMTVTVEYRFQFRLPGIGKLFGEVGPNGDYYVPLESTVTLQNEGPQNSSQTLGIGYGTFQ